MLSHTLAASGPVLAAGGGAAGGPNFLMIGVILVMVILLFVLPNRQKKKMQQQLQERQNAMGPGTRVMTQFGMFGTVVSRDQQANTVQLEIAAGTVVTVYLPAVTTVLDENGMVPGSPEARQAAVSRAQDEASAPDEAGTQTVAEQGTGSASTGSSLSPDGPSSTSERPGGTLNGEPFSSEHPEDGPDGATGTGNGPAR